MSIIKGALKCGGAICFYSTECPGSPESSKQCVAKGEERASPLRKHARSVQTPLKFRNKSLTGNPCKVTQESRKNTGPGFHSLLLPTGCVTLANSQNCSKPQCPQVKSGTFC